MIARPKQYRAEGTCSRAVEADPRGFVEWLRDGDRRSLDGARDELRNRDVTLHLQGRVTTYEKLTHDPTYDTELSRHVCLSTCVYVKTTRRLADRVHVVSIYAIGWPS